MPPRCWPDGDEPGQSRHLKILTRSRMGVQGRRKTLGTQGNQAMSESDAGDGLEALPKSDFAFNCIWKCCNIYTTLSKISSKY